MGAYLAIGQSATFPFHLSRVHANLIEYPFCQTKCVPCVNWHHFLSRMSDLSCHSFQWCSTISVQKDPTQRPLYVESSFFESRSWSVDPYVVFSIPSRTFSFDQFLPWYGSLINWLALESVAMPSWHVILKPFLSPSIIGRRREKMHSCHPTSTTSTLWRNRIKSLWPSEFETWLLKTSLLTSVMLEMHLDPLRDPSNYTVCLLFPLPQSICLTASGCRLLSLFLSINLSFYSLCMFTSLILSLLSFYLHPSFKYRSPFACPSNRHT